MPIRAVHQVVETKTLLSLERVKNMNYKYRKSLFFFVSGGEIKLSQEYKVSV